MDANLLPLVLALTQTQGIIVAVVVLLAVVIAWKFLKFAFRIALLVAAAVAIWFVLRWAGVL